MNVEDKIKLWMERDPGDQDIDDDEGTDLLVAAEAELRRLRNPIHHRWFKGHDCLGKIVNEGTLGEIGIKDWRQGKGDPQAVLDKGARTAICVEPIRTPVEKYRVIEVRHLV